MRTLTAVLTTILSLAGFLVASENAAPANDSFASATTLVLNGSSIAVDTNNTNATKETGEPDHADNAGGKSVWFSFTPTTTMNVRINVINTTFDTLLAVYTGTTVDDLTIIGSNDNCSNVCGGASTVDLMLVGGQTYRIAVDGANYSAGAPSGDFRIVIFSLTEPIQDNLALAYNLGTNFTGSIAGTNFNATSEPGEQIHHGGNPAVRSVWYRWQSSGGNYSIDFELSEDFPSVMTVWSSNVNNPTHAQLTRVNSVTDGVGFEQNKYRLTFYADASKTYFISIDGRSGAAQYFGNFQLRFRLHRMAYSFQAGPFERAYIGVYRPSNGIWYVLPPFGPPLYGNFGMNGDEPVPADYNGDAFTDLAVTRNESGKKVWYIKRDFVSPAYSAIQWGLATDKPVVGDYDLDGIADIAVTRQTANGLVWYVRRSSDAALRTFIWGLNTDKPVLGDFDGDRATEVAVTRVQNGALVWYILNSNGTGSYDQSRTVLFGLSGDIPAVEDFDGDLHSDIAVFRPSNGTWYILRSSDNQMQAINFGLAGDKPQPADYNGDGKADLAVFRPSEGRWYIAKPTGVPAQNFHAIDWGVATDVPVMSLSSLTQ